ncbi:hypothetical protein ACN38_g6925 [Penicillium nordicum]|uniref:Secreted protein n=1 Tax=Penicillium nordicum TaxID=229535 RepID=A0A0M9WEU1_9EURO|nr:hypothetical protein ACN38_g6925 [Penicillium nordicum]
MKILFLSILCRSPCGECSLALLSLLVYGRLSLSLVDISPSLNHRLLKAYALTGSTFLFPGKKRDPNVDVPFTRRAI